MKRVIAAAALTLLVLSGCAPTSQEPVYYVMFDDAPSIFDSGVYLRGERIGEIVSAGDSSGLASRVAVSVDPAFQERMQTRCAFVVSAGRLNLVDLAAYGEPLALGSLLSGFSSKAAYYRFRLANLLKPLPEAAAARARQLAAAAEGAAPVPAAAR